MAHITDEEIEELERLLEKATPGPWYQTGSPWFTCGSGVLAGSPDPHAAPMIADCETWEGQREEDRQSHPHLGDAEDYAALIAAALNALPSLLAEVKQARAEVERVREAAWREGREAAAALLDENAQYFNKIRAPGMANHDRSLAKRIRSLLNPTGGRDG